MSVAEQLLEVDYNSIKSDYLSFGFKEDNIRINNLRKNEDTLTAELIVEDFFKDGSGKFHFSATMAFIWFQQLTIMLIHMNLGLTKKTKEVFVTDCKIKFSKIITSKKITITVKIDSSFVHKDFTFYKLSYSANNDSFTATSVGCINNKVDIL